VLWNGIFIVNGKTNKMQIKRRQIIENVFNEAVQLDSAERNEFLDLVCGDDLNLREELELLLNEDEKNNRSEKEFFNQKILSSGKSQVNAENDKFSENTEFASYKIVKQIGGGGTGKIYLAEDTRLERPVALKIFPRGDNELNILRFQQEAKAASAISHINVAHIYEFNRAEDCFFLAMEFVEGKTLRQLLEEKIISAENALDIARQIANALSAAHRRGIVHRDIKPENIVVTEEGLVKVLDFGLAKMFAPDNSPPEKRSLTSSVDTYSGVIIGTTAYMSPEQIRGKELDIRTDLWSLGVILYEMLAGERPFQGKTPNDTQAEILLREPRTLTGKITQVLRDGEKVLEKVLSKDIQNRYQSATEFADDLNMLQGQLKEFEKLGKSVSVQNGDALEKKFKSQVFTSLKNTRTKNSISLKFVAGILFLLSLCGIGYLFYYFFK